MYVTMKDNFMSGWGEARDLINIYLVECETSEQADQIENAANERGEMEGVRQCEDKPHYPPSLYLVTEKDYSELGGCWIEDGGRL